MKTAFLKTEFPAHLKIPLALHLEILCWFRFGRRQMKVVAR